MTILPPDTANRTIILGPRELQILRLLWARGPATVREVWLWLNADPPLAYTTVMSTCVDLTTKGLLTRRISAREEVPIRSRQPYIYAPTIGELTFTRIGTGVNERYVAAHPVDATVPTMEASNADAVLRERAQAAECVAHMWETKFHRAELRIEALERQVRAAEERASVAERRVAALERQLGRPPRPPRKPRPPREFIIEHCDPSGICRVCRAPAPPPHGLRTDDLRVCSNAACRKEARRRDDLAKQRRFKARRKAKAAQ